MRLRLPDIRRAYTHTASPGSAYPCTSLTMCERREARNRIGYRTARGFSDFNGIRRYSSLCRIDNDSATGIQCKST